MSRGERKERTRADLVTAARQLAGQARQSLADRLVTAGAVPPPITVTAVAGIERDGGSGAKFATVRSRGADPSGPGR